MTNLERKSIYFSVATHLGEPESGMIKGDSYACLLAVVGPGFPAMVSDTNCSFTEVNICKMVLLMPETVWSLQILLNIKLQKISRKYIAYTVEK